MKNINDLLKVYNIEKEGNYYWKEDKDFIGSDIKVVFPYGLLHNDTMVTSVYFELLIDVLSLNYNHAHYSYSMGANYTLVNIRVFEIKNTGTALMVLWNAINNFEKYIDQHMKNPVIEQVINSYPEDLTQDFQYIKGLKEACDKTKEKTFSNKFLLEGSLRNAASIILEDTAYVFYQGAEKIAYMNRYEKEFLLPEIEYDLEKIEKEKFLIEFDEWKNITLLREVLHSTGYFRTRIKIFNNKLFLIFDNPKEEVKKCLEMMSDKLELIFDEQNMNPLVSYINFNFNNIINNYKKDISYIVNSFLSNGYAFEDIEEAVNHSSMKDIVALMKDCIISKL